MADLTEETRADLRERQDRRLRETVRRCYDEVSFYSERFDEAGLSPEDVQSVEDLTRLPLTTKADFQRASPDDLLAVDRSDLARFHASSGTTSEPKIVAYDESDLDVWETVMARSLSVGGLDAGDTLQNAYNMGLFTGGFGFHDGARRLGACVLPTGGGNTRRQIELMVELGSTAICLTPSYAIYLAERAEELGYDPRALPVETVFYGAEPCTDELRREIEDRLGAEAYENYGLSELIGPGVAATCEQQVGLHVWEDHFYPEVVDPETGEPVEPGEPGELVLTSLTRTGLPVLRYRTGDRTRLLEEPCNCGRPHRRIARIDGRVDDLLVVRGVNVYPTAVESAILEVEGTAPQYRIDVTREDRLDSMAITVEAAAEFDGDTDALRDEVEARLSSVLALTPDEVTVVPHGHIERSEVGKVTRVYDHRE